jgi:hypothetical protein
MWIVPLILSAITKPEKVWRTEYDLLLWNSPIFEVFILFFWLSHRLISMGKGLGGGGSGGNILGVLVDLANVPFRPDDLVTFLIQPHIENGFEELRGAGSRFADSFFTFAMESMGCPSLP